MHPVNNGLRDLAHPLNLRLIGCSDLPVLAGLSAYSSPVEIWTRIVHGIQPSRPDWLDEAGHIGNELEMSIARLAAWKLGLTLEGEGPHKPESIDNPCGAKWARCSFDPILFSRERPSILTECKARTTRSLESQGWGEPGTAEVAPAVYAQVQAQMAWLARGIEGPDLYPGMGVHEIDHVLVAVLVDGQKLQLYPVPRDPEIGEALLELGARFWRDHVETGIAPPWDGTEAATRALAARYPRGNGEVREATPREARLLGAYERAASRVERAEEELELARQRLCEAIGESTGLQTHMLRARWSERAGRVSFRAVIDELAKRAEVSTAELQAIEDRHRGSPSRVLDVRPVKGGKGA